MSRNTPNPRLLQTARQLEHLAEQTTLALEHIRVELTLADSYPTQVPGASPATATGNAAVCRCAERGWDGCDVCTPVTLTPAERGADARWRLQKKADTITATIGDLETLAAKLSDVCRTTIGVRLAHVPRCDGRGLEGSELPYTPYSQDPRNGWHRADCSDAADNSGLCPACRVREARWRRENGLPPRRTNAGVEAA